MAQDAEMLYIDQQVLQMKCKNMWSCLLLLGKLFAEIQSL